MRRFSRHLCFLALVGGAFGAAQAEAGPSQIGIAVAGFSFLDTSGEPTDQTGVHQRRLTDFMAALGRDLAADGRFKLVPAVDGDAPPQDQVQAAKAAGAKFLVIGGIHKTSTLVQWAKVDAIDIAADRSVLSKLLTFRGDTDESWLRAEAFVSRDLLAALGAGKASAP